MQNHTFIALLAIATPAATFYALFNAPAIAALFNTVTTLQGGGAW